MLRRPVDAVQAGIDVMRDAEDAARKEARRVLRKQQREEWRDKLDDGMEETGEKWDAFQARLKGENKN